MLLKVHGLFHYQSEAGLYLIVPSVTLPFEVNGYKVLESDQASFYNQTPYYESMVEMRFDAKGTLLAWMASEGVATREPRPWVSAIVQFVVQRSDRFYALGKSFASHESIALGAYYRSVAGEGGTPLDHWVRAENELLQSRLELDATGCES